MGRGRLGKQLQKLRPQTNVLVVQVPLRGYEKPVLCFQVATTSSQWHTVAALEASASAWLGGGGILWAGRGQEFWGGGREGGVDFGNTRS